MYLVFAIASKVIVVLQWLIIAWALMSWFQPNPRNPIVKLIHGIIDPVMRPIRALIPTFGGLDLSPLVAILLLQMIEWVFRQAAVGAYPR